MKSRIDRRKEIIHETEAAKKEGSQIRAPVITWLEDVEMLQPRVNRIHENQPSTCFLNFSKRYKGSREVEEILDNIKRLLKAGKFPHGLVYPTRVPRAVEHIPGPSIQDQTTASKVLEKTMRLLSDDRFQRIGIWGLGGVGKTTMVITLNNELKSTTRNIFGVIIWVSVSKNLDMKQVQTQIALRLNLEMKMEESVERMAIRLHQRLTNEEKYLLILDDVWQKLDLDSLGVPQPDVHKGSKIILTTRFMEVCRKMMTDVEVKVDVLNDEEAWQLFSQKAGDVAHLEGIKPFAEAIARECCGLPLAIIIVGAAMRRKTKVELWEDALKELQRSVPSVEGIEYEVYKPLKWSYDSLQGKNTKSCFLYCSFFPEDFSIEVSELVLHWRAEGLIDEQQNYVDSVNREIALIENLKDSRLLEDGSKKGTVKMHDVVRDVAIWITSSSEDGCKSLVRSEFCLSEISVGEFSNSLKRVSFMNSHIESLPNCLIQCLEVSTLLLQGSCRFEKVPYRFLLGFEALKVLNLSRTNIHSLPDSLLQLGDLCALFLRHCKYIEVVPILGSLRKLQILDLCEGFLKALLCLEFPCTRSSLFQ
ncbi:disease resistance protein At4g27190-like [Quercus lobata]|uniref:disease resistance protein At4g27190-like n=1 Tax=Quercus lobata TaxID=97700 RepID=UPI001247A11B|nr:disease resistance protein At4g27190-like [Quercus lobata]